MAVFGDGLLGLEVDAVLPKRVLFAEGILVLHFSTLFDKLLDAKQEFFEIEGFGQVVVGAFTETQDAVGAGIPGAENEDGNVVVLNADGLGDADAVHPGQHDIEDNEIEVLRLDSPQGAATIKG